MRLGRIRAIGVSNFHLPDLEELVQISDILPDVVQAWYCSHFPFLICNSIHSTLRFDPFHQEKELRKFCSQHKIVFQAYRFEISSSKQRMSTYFYF
jgi:diketogulonate reductase-like aldo/keto reductase